MTGDDGSTLRLPVLAAVIGAALLLGARGLPDESAAMLGGDMARYVMNGVFMYDLIADGGGWSVGDLVRYAERYYARYPALSLGLHPPLPSAALVPFFAVFGISILAARLAALAWFVIAAAALYALARRLFGWRAASWTTALFVTNVFVLRAGQYVWSEMPMLALVLMALTGLVLYGETKRARRFALFVAAVLASLLAKLLAVLLFPVYAAVVLNTGGARRLTRLSVALAMIASAALVVLLALATLRFAPDNADIVRRNVSGLLTGSRFGEAPGILAAIVTTHLSAPALIAALGGAVALAFRRERAAIVPLVWIASVLAGTVVFTGTTEPARYAFSALPAYFLLAGGLAATGRSAAARTAATGLLSAALIWQAWTVRDVRPSGAGGYEPAARFAIEHAREPAILYDSAVDTGYFVFFVRKHDPARRLIVLRADKLWPAPPDDAPASGEPAQPDEIYSALRRFGVRWIVVENQPASYPILRLLHDELATSRFAERLRLPITSLALPDGQLAVYEFLDATPADPDAELHIGLPKGGREIRIPFGDLVDWRLR